MFLTLLCTFVYGEVFAQDRVISGKVTSKEDGTPLPGVTVAIKGTSLGTSTDVEGTFKLNVPADAKFLVFSFIGMTTKEEEIGSRSTIDVALSGADETLNEVVVTAIGIERNKRTLGYSFQEVKGDAIAQKSEPNVLNALQGKVAGVNIVGGSGSPGASTNINIRGISSFTGSNQPLFVIDGIPVSNDVDRTSTGVFDSQPSNRMVDINPDNIASINILKGPAASALYGSRGSAGAIIITTKAGSKNVVKKTEVTISSSVNFQDVYGLPVYQNSYGQGANNILNNQSTNSWGPKFGTPGFETYINSQNQTRTYQAAPNNIKDFYRTGTIFSNSANILTGSEKSTFNLSLSNTLQSGISPYSSLTRTSGQLVAGTQLSNNLRVTGNITFTQTQNTAPSQGNGGSAFGQITRIPRSYDLPNEQFEAADGSSVYFISNIINPKWSVKNESNSSVTNRVTGNFTLDYNVTKWLNVKYRGGVDTYIDTRRFVSAVGAARNPQGAVSDISVSRTELNGDLMISANKENFLMNGLNVSLLLGHNMNQRENSTTDLSVNDFKINFFNPGFGAVFTNSSKNSSLRRLVGVYSQLNFGYKNFLFVDLTVRGDQSSTLPVSNNTFIYPSVNVGFVFTDAFKINSNILTYGKLRANMAQVGRDADPYSLQSVYGVAGFGNNLASITFPISSANGTFVGYSPASQIGNPKLTPEFTTSQEIGLDLGLFKNRLRIEAGYYYQVSEKQIIPVAIANSSGYDTRVDNVGRMENQGLELLISGTPIKTQDLKWDISLNFSNQRNKVVSITEGVKQFQIPGSSFGGITPSIVVGQPYGAIVSTARATNDKGEWLINPLTGLYAPGIPNSVVAVPQPDFIAGISNSITYKGINLSVLFDIRQGGQLFSFGMNDLRGNGSLKITEADRDQPRIMPGVIETVGADGKKTYTPNNIQISAQSYWANLGGLGSQASVFDATVYRLREVSLGYSIPKKLLTKLPFGDITVSMSARNLWFFAPGFPGDPELNKQGAGNIQGLDLSGAPNVRNYGFNLRFSF